MATQDYSALLRSVGRGELAPVYYLYGPEETLKDEAAQAILGCALDPSGREFNFDQQVAGQLDPEGLHTLLNTLPMMAGRRVVFLREVELLKKKPKHKAVLLKYLERPSPDLVVVLLQSPTALEPDPDIARAAFAVDVVLLSPDRVVRWLIHRAQEAGVAFAPKAAEHLALAADHDLTTLHAELEKLAAGWDGTPVTVERVEAMVGVRYGETPPDWRDAVLDDDPGRAIRLLPIVLSQSGVTGVSLVITLGTALVGVEIARGYFDGGLRGRALEGAVFKSLSQARPQARVDWKLDPGRWVRWAATWTGPRIRRALRAALKADQDLKNTRISDDAAVLTDLVLELAFAAREAA